MNFECSERCGTGEWTTIDHETLLRECTDEQITMMIFYKATIRTAKKLYRRVIPEVIPDWAKINKQVTV